MLGIDSRNYRPNGTQTPRSARRFADAAELLESIETTLANYTPVIYEQNLQGILHDLSPAQNGGLAAAWAFCISTTYRRARAAVLSLRNGKAPSKTLVSEITSALNDVRTWSTASDGKSVPIGVDGTAKHVTALRRLADDDFARIVFHDAMAVMRQVRLHF